jgi:hypothetical protein
MNPQRTFVGPVGIEQERKRVGEQSGLSSRDQQAERMGADQLMLDLDTVFAKKRRLIHHNSLAAAG